MRVVLFNPPDRHLLPSFKFDETVVPPFHIDLGIASIAAYVEHHSDITCIPYSSGDYSIAALKEFLRTNRPSVIGLSCVSYNRFACLELARLMKALDPSVTVILGGAHATCLDRQILRTCPDVDYIVRGEGEITFLDLLDALRQGKDLRKIRGISFLHSGKVMRTAPRARVASLDEFPLIDYSKYQLQPLGRSWEKEDILSGLPVEITRGCPFVCLFCSAVGFWGRKTVKRSVERAIEQIRLIPEAYRKHIIFPDLTFTLDKAYTRAFCSAVIASGMDLHWGCQTRVHLIDKPLLKIMKKAGCKMILFGVESLSGTVLRSIHKEYDPEVAIANANLTAEMGIRVHFNLIVGFPQETKETLMESLIGCRKLHPGITLAVHPLEIVPGAPLYDVALGEGFDEAYWLEDHAEALPYYTGSIPAQEQWKWVKKFERVTARNG